MCMFEETHSDRVPKTAHGVLCNLTEKKKKKKQSCYYCICVHTHNQKHKHARKHTHTPVDDLNASHHAEMITAYKKLSQPHVIFLLLSFPFLPFSFKS